MMTTHTVIQSAREKHLAAIPAMQAAFAIGRARYLSLKAWEDGGGLVRVQNALAAMGKAARNVEAVVIGGIGGGFTTRGKIKWLIENKPGITSREIEDILSLSQPLVCQNIKQLVMGKHIRRDKVDKANWQYFKEEVAA